jgi:hypothetical protein
MRTLRRVMGRGIGVAAVTGGMLFAGASTAQEGGSPAGGDVLFAECFAARQGDAAELALLRAECDVAAEGGGYLAGIWRPLEQKVDGAVPIKCPVPNKVWVCAGVPSRAAGSPTQ